MEAKDTRLTDSELALIKDRYVRTTEIFRPDIADYVLAVRDRQAENSFSFGEKQGYERGYEAGRKEIIEPLIPIVKKINAREIHRLISEWQAELKKWGMWNKE